MKKVLIILFVFIGGLAIAQPQNYFCGSAYYKKQLETQNPELVRKSNSINAFAYQYNVQKNLLKQNNPNHNLQPTAIYTIPVVVHIIHQNGPENISNAQVVQQIQDLNEAFRNIGYYDPASGVDVGIEFCFAQQDPNGNATNGINRISSPLTNLTMETQDPALKALIQWNSSKYMNVWVVNDISSTSQGPTVAGYSTFPGSHGLVEDGVVCEANTFGTNKDLSKIMVHEVGHYLGLFHTFEGGCTNNNCLTNNDYVCDTPPDASTASFSCAAPPNTCNTDDDDVSANNPFRPIANGGLGDQPDMIQNYMDYGNKACQSVFTQGQKDRMVPILLNIRLSLLTSKVCLPPCANPLSANFTVSPSPVTVNTVVNFTNTSTGTGTSIWSVDGNIVSNATNITQTFNAVGTHTVILTFTNGDTACTDTAIRVITVKCNTLSSFTYSPSTVNPGDNVTFTANSPGATMYEWFVDGTSVGTNPTYAQTFNSLGGSTVYLVTYNGSCYDTSFQYVQVGTCGGKEANHWYFGDKAGIDFSGGSPVADINGRLFSQEGCASISDKNGNLLFYSDGDTVWNKNHLLMQNGGNLFNYINASESSTQGAIIIPQPKNPNIYYLFSTPFGAGQYGQPSRMIYSVIDMSANGGLGAVIQKGITLFSPTPEKVTATKHENGCDVWIIAHEWNTANFRAYLLSSTGLSTTPVISSVGSVHSGGFGGGGNTAGCMKMSVDGKRLALAIQDTSWIEIFDFNTATGVFTNPIKLNVWAAPFGSFPYGIEFSPNGRFLYVSNNAISGPSLNQYDLNATTPASILASKVYVGPASYIQNAASLQLGPNGKIYLAKIGDQYLGAINLPNVKGIGCNYVQQSVFLGGKVPRLGLPNFMSSLFTPIKPEIDGPDTVCLSTVPYKIVACEDSITWTVVGNATLDDPHANPVNVTFTSVGQVKLIVQKETDCGPKFDTLTIVATSGTLSLGSDTSLCSSSIVLSAPAGLGNYTWNTGATTQNISVNTPGQYWVKSTFQSCSLVDTITVNPAPTQTLDLGNDTVLCNGNVLELDAGTGFKSYKWQDFHSDRDYTATYAPGKYWVTVQTQCGSLLSDTINISAAPSIAPDLKDTALCNGGNITLDAGAGFNSYLWSDTSTQQTLSITQGGTYWVQVTNASGCFGIDSVNVAIINGNNINVLGNDTGVCGTIGNMTLDAGSIFNSYLWSNGATTQTITVSQSGNYWVQVSSSAGCSGTDTISVLELTAAPSQLLPADTTICGSAVNLNLDAGAGYGSYQWSSGATTQSINAQTAGVVWVQVYTNEGCMGEDSITIATKPAVITPLLGNDTSICKGPINLTLDAGAGYAAYLWSDSTTAQTLTVTQAGTYQIEVTNAVGCKGTDDITIQTSAGLPTNFLGDDTTICLYEDVLLVAVDGYLSYQWNDGSGRTSYLVSEEGEYWVTITDNVGCTTADTVKVNIKDCLCGAWLPNAFSPNGDGENDELKVRGNCIKSIRLLIFDRWGAKVFETRDVKEAWDGKFKGNELDAGVFVYFLDVDLYNGESKVIKGNVCIVK